MKGVLRFYPKDRGGSSLSVYLLSPSLGSARTGPTQPASRDVEAALLTGSGQGSAQPSHWRKAKEDADHLLAYG